MRPNDKAVDDSAVLAEKGKKLRLNIVVHVFGGRLHWVENQSIADLDYA